MLASNDQLIKRQIIKPIARPTKDWLWYAPMTQDIKITGFPGNDPMVCKFVVDRALLPEGLSIQVVSQVETLDSPLLTELFAIEGIGKIYLGGAQVAVTKNSPSPWPEIGKKVGSVIRAQIQADKPLFTELLLTKIRTGTTGEIAEKVKELFVTRINPELASHGGFVELTKVIDNDVYLRLGGGCQGCASSLLTLRQGIEKEIHEKLPSVRHVIDDTDHAAGANPYYK
jgi:Fe-S cluster biogenesis protein NfuA